jgi:hypothetical protein
LCRELTGLRVMPTRVRLTHRRDDAGSKSEFAEFFGGDLEFGAATDDVAFAASVGQMPVASADPYLNKILIAHCEEALSLRPRKSGSFGILPSSKERNTSTMATALRNTLFAH